jgi:Kef-type K+ transport system membrane component KefB
VESSHPALYIMTIAVAAALFAQIPPRLRLPSAVFEMAFGWIIGPQGFGILAVDGLLTWLGTAGLAALFFMSGLELDLSRVRGRPISLAMSSWLVSLGLGIAAGFCLYAVSLAHAPMWTGLALTTTSMATVMAVLRDTDQLGSRFATFVIASGAIGEFGPVLVTSLAFTHGASELRQVLLLCTFAFIAVFAAVLALRVRPPRLLRTLRAAMNSSTQLPVRLSMLLVILFVVLSERLGFEIVLGAFAAGMVVGLASRGEGAQPLHEKMDGVCYGFLVPFFFVTSGMKFDLATLLSNPRTMLLVPLFLGLFLLVRGVPVFLYRRELEKHDRLPFALYSATALSMVIAVTQIAVETKRMLPSQAAALSVAALISALIFPSLADNLRSGSARATDRAA